MHDVVLGLNYLVTFAFGASMVYYLNGWLRHPTGPGKFGVISLNVTWICVMLMQVVSGTYLLSSLLKIRAFFGSKGQID